MELSLLNGQHGLTALPFHFVLGRHRSLPWGADPPVKEKPCIAASSCLVHGHSSFPFSRAWDSLPGSRLSCPFCDKSKILEPIHTALRPTLPLKSREHICFPYYLWPHSLRCARHIYWVSVYIWCINEHGIQKVVADHISFLHSHGKNWASENNDDCNNHQVGNKTFDRGWAAWASRVAVLALCCPPRQVHNKWHEWPSWLPASGRRGLA